MIKPCPRSYLEIMSLNFPISLVVTQVTVILRNEVDVDLGGALDFVIKTWSPDTRSADPVFFGSTDRRSKKTTIKFQKSVSFKNSHAPRDNERKRKRAITRV